MLPMCYGLEMDMLLYGQCWIRETITKNSYKIERIEPKDWINACV